MSKTFYLIAGANGSGKTTLAHELLREEKGMVFLNADEIASKIKDNTGFSAGRIIFDKADKLRMAGTPIAMESTISGRYHEQLIRQFKDSGYEIILVYVFLDSPEINIARIKKRVILGGHNVPDDDVIRRFTRSVKNFWNTIKLADRWKLFYNGDDNYELVAEGNTKTSEVLNDVLYKKFKNGLKNG